MKRLRFFSPATRPIRAIINCLLTVALAVVFYISIGCPTFSFTQEFRRAEKVHMVGESVIVDTVTNHPDYSRMIVGETEHGICFFGMDMVQIASRFGNPSKAYYTLTYCEKTADVTVAIAPNDGAAMWDMMRCSFPVYIFDEHPEAVRAEIRTTVTGKETYYSEGKKVTVSFKETFTAEAERSGEGYFRFTLTNNDENGGRALGLLSMVGSGAGLSSENKSTVIPFTVRLYDENGALVVEKVFILQAGSVKS